MPKQRPFKPSIPPDKDSSKRKAQAVTEEIQVFTDGSVLDDKVGATAALTRPDKNHRAHTIILDAEQAGVCGPEPELSIHLYVVLYPKVHGNVGRVRSLRMHVVSEVRSCEYSSRSALQEK